MTRDDNRHAKAGNINRALAQIGSPFVAVFDSDHVPTRSFLQVTMGWFLRDRKLAPAADAAPLLLSRPVRAQPGPVPHHAQRRRAVLWRGAGRQRLLERGVLLRLLRCAPPQRAGRGGRHRGGDGDRGRAHIAAHADARMEHGLHQHSAGGRPGHRAAVRACEPAHPLGARHGAGAAHREPAVRARAEAGATALLLQCDVTLPVRSAAADLPDCAADLSDLRTGKHSGLLADDRGLCARRTWCCRT